MLKLNADRIGLAYQAAKRELFRQEQEGKLKRAHEGPIGIISVSGEVSLARLVEAILTQDDETRAQLTQEAE